MTPGVESRKSKSKCESTCSPSKKKTRRCPSTLSYQVSDNSNSSSSWQAFFSRMRNASDFASSSRDNPQRFLSRNRVTSIHTLDEIKPARAVAGATYGHTRVGEARSRVTVLGKSFEIATKKTRESSLKETGLRK